MCGSLSVITLEYEYFFNNLRKEIDYRAAESISHLSVLEMMRLVVDLVDLFCFLQGEAINHGEINPTLIFLAEDQETGLLRPKVCERLSGCGNKFVNSFQGFAQKKELYVCPSLFHLIVAGIGVNQKTVDSHKSEVFSLGI